MAIFGSTCNANPVLYEAYGESFICPLEDFNSDEIILGLRKNILELTHKRGVKVLENVQEIISCVGVH